MPTVFQATASLVPGSTLFSQGRLRTQIAASFALESSLIPYGAYVHLYRHLATARFDLQGDLSAWTKQKAILNQIRLPLSASVLVAAAYIQGLSPPTFEGVASNFDEILIELLDNLAQTVSSKTRSDSAAVRQQIGIVRSDYPLFLQSDTFGDELLSCFTLAREAGTSLTSLAYVRDQLFAAIPDSAIATALVQMAIVFCLSTESQMIAAVEFVSRDDVEATMTKMKVAFDTAKELAADDLSSGTYQSLTYLHGALTNHLATTARPLPRMINFSLKQTLPTLALSQRLYYVSTRAEELASENKIVHPAFAPMAIRGLSG